MFYNCSKLETVNIPNSVTSIGNEAFTECMKLSSITIPNSVTSIGNLAFRRCWALKSVTLPNSVTSLGTGVFSSCLGLTGFDWPSSLPTINNSTFNGCTFSSFIIPNTVTSIGSNAFSYSALSSITIPSSVTSIEEKAFNASALTNVIIPSSVTSIGANAFSDCLSLESVTINSTNLSIGASAFLDCYKLTSFKLESITPPLITKNVFETTGINDFDNVYNTALLMVPAGSLAAYRNDAVWNKFKNISEPVTTSILNNSVSNFSVSPNPATDHVTVTFTESVLGTVSIVDLQGNVVSTNAIAGNTANIATANLACGIYVVKIASDKGFAVKQLIKK